MEEVINVCNVKDLESLRKLNNKSKNVVVNVMNNLEFNNDFVPINLENFTGDIKIEGNNKIFHNLYINTLFHDNVGLFGKLNEKSLLIIRDLTIKCADIIGKNNVGVLLGSGNVYIENCNIISSDVKGYNNVGTVVGDTQSTMISNSKIHDASVLGDYNVGGFVGQSTKDVMLCDSIIDGKVCGIYNTKQDIGNENGFCIYKCIFDNKVISMEDIISKEKSQAKLIKRY